MELFYNTVFIISRLNSKVAFALFAKSSLPLRYKIAPASSNAKIAMNRYARKVNTIQLHNSLKISKIILP